MPSMPVMPPMSMNRLLSRREKDGAGHKRDKSRDKAGEKKASQSVTSLCAAFSNTGGKTPPLLATTLHSIHGTIADIRTPLTQTRPISGDGILNLFKGDPQKKLDKELNNKVSTIKDRLQKAGYPGISDDHINYALGSKHADGDAEKAYEMVLLFQQSVEGLIKPYDPSIVMLGAENREGVTCYLDSLLFAMFAKLGSFEPILYTNFDDEPRRRLSTLIRLWVNMLRTGKLIPTDVTQYLQGALAACGWEEAAKLEQQDTSEAFRFITETLQLPLLTMKVDIFHPGREEEEDDHKYIHERLLEVAVPEDTPADRPIRLEDCLENYFNNQIEVQRKILALERSNTLSSVNSSQSESVEKGSSQHVEISEVSWSNPATPTSLHSPSTPLTPGGSRHRAMSIIVPRMVEEDSDEAKAGSSAEPEPYAHSRQRKGSMRKGREVLMPAWQFFNLIPWYTSMSTPTGDAGVYAHFTKTRPVLGICLKRYGFANGKPTRNGTFIDIPLDLRLPHFVDDGKNPEDGHLSGDFKLSLQAAICHRGNSVNEGHYISIIRGTTPIADGDSQSNRRLSDANRPPHYPEERWIKFDDIGKPRVNYVNIEDALKRETPYLLFYQILHLDESPAPSEGHPPSYTAPSCTDSGVGMQTTQSSPEFGSSPIPRSPHQPGYFDGAKEDSMPTIRLSSENDRLSSPRQSTDHTSFSEDRRASIAVTETSLASTATSMQGTSAPVTPIEETTSQRISRAAASFTKKTKSRPGSQSGENRISGAFSRLNWTRSKEQLNRSEISTSKEMAKETSKETIPSPDGPGPHISIAVANIEAVTPEPALERTKSKKGKKRSKSRDPAEKLDLEGKEKEKHHHIHRGKGKNKEGKEKEKDTKEKEKAKGVPDRECRLM